MRAELTKCLRAPDSRRTRSSHCRRTFTADRAYWGPEWYKSDPGSAGKKPASAFGHLSKAEGR